MRSYRQWLVDIAFGGVVYLFVVTAGLIALPAMIGVAVQEAASYPAGIRAYHATAGLLAVAAAVHAYRQRYDAMHGEAFWATPAVDRMHWLYRIEANLPLAAVAVAAVVAQLFLFGD